MVIALFATMMPSHASLAQDASLRVRAQRDTLERIKREREDLEKQSLQLQSSAHDLNDEVAMLDHRADVAARLVKALDTQLAVITDEVDSASGKLSQAEGELAARHASLQRRLVDIYERGPLYTTEAMLSAHSFGELVARYKYLHLLALHDRSLVARVEQLRDEVSRRRDQLVALQSALADNRADKKLEEDRLIALERERASSLANVRRQAKVTDDRLARLKATETQLTSAIAALDAERRRVDNARPSATRPSSTIKTSDYGSLDWPVDGPLVYTFGKAQTASNNTIRWNGVGIKAAVGTNVRSVAAGRVASVGPFGTYGLTVIIEHGGGDYSIYGSLARSDVRVQQTVTKGDVIGAVGVSDPDLPAHLHFEIRHSGADGRPASVDPATWLKDRK